MPCDNSTDKDKTAAYFSHQVAALVQALFCNFFVLKNHKTADDSTTTKAQE